jgi:hypothetical protein
MWIIGTEWIFDALIREQQKTHQMKTPRYTVEELIPRALDCAKRGISWKEWILSFEHRDRDPAHTAWARANGQPQ